MTHTYSPGDLVKIISLEKVRSYQKNENGNYRIGGIWWISCTMDVFAGTTREIEKFFEGIYYLKGDDNIWQFSPEMIEGPAEQDRIQEQILAMKIHTAKIIASGPEGCRKYLASLELEFDDSPAEAPEPETDSREKYAERLERFVLAVAATRGPEYTTYYIINDAKDLLAAFDEEVKKYKP